MAAQGSLRRGASLELVGSFEGPGDSLTRSGFYMGLGGLLGSSWGLLRARGSLTRSGIHVGLEGLLGIYGDLRGPGFFWDPRRPLVSPGVDRDSHGDLREAWVFGGTSRGPRRHLWELGISGRTGCARHAEGEGGLRPPQQCGRRGRTCRRGGCCWDEAGMILRRAASHIATGVVAGAGWGTIGGLIRDARGSTLGMHHGAHGGRIRDGIAKLGVACAGWCTIRDRVGMHRGAHR